MISDHESARSCCFSGHRDLDISIVNPLTVALTDCIRRLYSIGITHYYAGGAVGFDMLASVTLLNLRHELTSLSLTLVLPCTGHTRNWRQFDVELFDRVKSRADEIICPEYGYRRGCMSARNRYMVDRSEYCVCYLTRNSGGTYYTARYAEEHGRQIINLAKELTE